MIDNGAGYIQVIVAALLRVGYSGKQAWKIAENDKYAFQFYSDLIYCRERICDYQKQRISYVEMLGSIVAFCFKNLRRAWRGSIISRECLSPSNLDKMAGAGLEEIAPNLLLFLVLQEYPPDVPRPSPTLNAKIASFDRTLDPNFPPTGVDITSPSITAPPLYSFELDAADIRPATGGGSNDTLTMKGFNHDKTE